MKIMCNIVTGAIRDLAKQINRSDSFTCNLLSVWQTQNNSVEYPTAAQLQSLMDANKEQMKDIYFAIPNYTTVPFAADKVPIQHKDGQVQLMLLPKDKSLEHFYNMFSQIPELRKLVSTAEEAYRFMLWREMAFMQRNLPKSPEYRAIVEGEALQKLKEWKKQNPVKVIESYDGVTFTESAGSYRQRTIENITWSDVTLAFVIDDRAPGERLTEREGINQGKYEAEFLTNLEMNDIPRHVRNILIAMQTPESYGHKGKVLPTQNIKLNIAGNSIDYAVTNGMNQNELNDYVTEYLKQLIAAGVTISEIRSGGQTGIDEAGIIAAQRLGIPASVHAPQGFTFRTVEGKDIYDKEAFLGRFINTGEISSNVQVSETGNPEMEDQSGTQVETLPTNQLLSFSVEQATAADTQVVSQAEANNVYNIPNIGTEVIQPNDNNPLIKLAKDFTATQRYDRVRMLARNFSDIVSKAVQEKLQDIEDAIAEENAKETPDDGELARLKEKAELFNDSVKGRRAVMQEKTLQQIFKEMKEEIESYLEIPTEELDEDFGEGMGEYMQDAYQKVLNNWDELLKEASIIIESTEHVRIKTIKHAYNTGSTTVSVVDGIIGDSIADSNNIEMANADDEESRVANGNSGWSFQVRYVDPANTLSKKVKDVLTNIKKEGLNGELERDDLGNIRYLNGEFAHVALLNELAGMVDADDFSIKQDDNTYIFPALKKAALKYPWVNQVIAALSADPSLISSFYADFRKDFVPYWIQYFNEDLGKWQTKSINQSTGFETAKNTIINNYEQGSILDADSLYDSGRNISTDNAQLGTTLVNDTLSLLREYDEEDTSTIVEKTAKAVRMVGLRADETLITNLLQTEDGINSLTKALNALRNIFDNSTKLEEGAHLINALSNDFNVLAEELGIVYELDYIASSRNGDKTYYSYAAPNYIETLIKFFQNDDRRDIYLQNQYGKYDWFKDPTTGEWNSEWLHLIETDENVRDQIAYKNLLSIGGIDYTNWRPSQIKSAFVREYFSVPKNKGSKQQFAWYNMPIFSDSPVTMMLKFLRYTSDNEGTFKSKLLPLFNKVVMQELGRIKKVQERRKEGAAPIANYDTRGLQFCFFPELNTYNNGRFLEEAITLSKDEQNVKELDALINSAIEDIMNNAFDSFLTSNNAEFNALQQSLLSEGVVTSNEGFIDALEEYFWNQAYATTQIIELTTTDLAFYKNDIDFQKRYKEVYAAGTKLNTNSTYGRKIERTIYLRDQVVTSSSYNDIKISLDRAVQLGHIKSYDRDNILNKFKGVNVADAQAYRSLSSMRAVLDMMGVWNPKMEAAVDRFQSGDWDMSDFNVVWQTIKPFVYTQIEKPDGLGGTIKVPHHNKNSEFLLLAAHNIISSSLAKSPKLKAINRFMEDSGIDVVQFESACKVGAQGVIDLSYSESKLQSWVSQHPNLGLDGTVSFKTFKSTYDNLLDEGKISQKEYNEAFKAIEPSEQEVYDMLQDLCYENGDFAPETVHEIPYDDYVIQQPTPEHLFDHVAVFGSQFRNLIVSDMPNDPDFRVNVNGKSLTKQEVLSLYQALITENLLDDWEDLKGKFTNIRTLQQALLNSIGDNLKYSRDMVDALQIVEITNPRTGEKQEVFNIPLDNPTTTTKIQEITSSMFKNAITKQYIKGASCILVSDFGLTDELHVLHGKDGSIQGFECYLPAYSKKFYQPFLVAKTDEKTGKTYYELDINKMPLDLRKIIGYRIPTEDKYSMAPLIIKGFLPQQNGSAIMLPAEITEIAGSDFDVDKMFLMIPEFDVYEFDKRKAREDYAKVNAVFNQLLGTYTHSDLLKDALSIDEKEGFAAWFASNKEKYRYETPRIVKVKYDMSKKVTEQTGNKALLRRKRNNMLIDISWGILTNPDTAEKLHNPGNFDKVKIAARIASIVNDPYLLVNFAQNYGIFLDKPESIESVARLLLSMSKDGKLDELNDFINEFRQERSQLTVDTFIYNHKQNMTGAALIGIYANNTSMQAKCQNTSLAIKDGHTFFINGRKIQSLHDIISAEGERISKNCANFSAASVDGVKDPVLADLMQNKKTAYIAGFMLRAGMSVEEIGLLFSQPLVKQCIDVTGSLEMLDITIAKAIETLHDNNGGVDTNLASYNPSSMDLLMNCLNEHFVELMTPEARNKHLADEIRAALLMQHIVTIANDLNNLTTISRADSPNGAIEPSIAGAKVQVQMVNKYLQQQNLDKFTLVGVDDVIQYDYITADMSKDQMREKILKRKMPVLQAFYSLGIELSHSVLSNYYSQTTPYSDALVEHVFNNSPNGIVPAKTLDKFYKELVEFALSKTTLFGDDANATFDEKRDYYLYDYPKEFLSTLNANPDLAAMNIFKKLEVKNGTILMNRSGRFTPLMIETLMRDFDILLNDSDNPVAQKIAIDLFMYSYYQEGFKFGPHSFGKFFSSNFIASFPELVSALRNLRFDMKSGSYFDEFLSQFYANNWEMSNLVPAVNGSNDVVMELPDGRIAVIAKACLNTNLISTGVVQSFPLIKYSPQGSNQQLLYAVSLEGNDRVIYSPAYTFTNAQKGKRGVKYNANMDVVEMQGITPNEARVKANSEINPVGFNYGQATEETLYNELGGNLDSLLGDLWNAQGPVGIDNALAFMEQDYSEELGQSQLDEPMCINI